MNLDTNSKHFLVKSEDGVKYFKIASIAYNGLSLSGKKQFKISYVRDNSDINAYGYSYYLEGNTKTYMGNEFLIVEDLTYEEAYQKHMEWFIWEY